MTGPILTLGACGRGALSLPVSGSRAGRAFRADDWVAEEVPIALEFNGISHAVMLASPVDLDDFALGFALSEGILAGSRELYGVDVSVAPNGITVHLDVAAAAFARLKDRRRSMAGRSGCGLCGSESLGQVARELPEIASRGAVTRSAIAEAMAQLGKGQTLQQATGATHAAAWCGLKGDVRCLREDIGRHNALDKLIGALARANVDAASGFVAITSRASFEMVQKTVLAGVPLLAAVSAPTSLAVTTADHSGLTLVGFARAGDLVVYSHPGRVALIG